MLRPLSRTLLLLALPALLATLVASPAPAHAQPPAAGPSTGQVAAAFADHTLIEVSYLLRAPDGALVRITRRPDAGPAGAAGAPARWAADAPARWAEGAPRVVPVIGSQGWLGRWLLRTPELYQEVGDTVRATWSVIVRLLDYVGVIVLFGGTWVIWFLVRPTLVGVPDRTAFLLVFAVVAGLWSYATGLHASVAYALGLMLVPALGLALAGLAVRRLWSLLRAPA